MVTTTRSQQHADAARFAADTCCSRVIVQMPLPLPETVEVKMALAVLQGDMVAAKALADKIVNGE
jgi:hypothetical protein